MKRGRLPLTALRSFEAAGRLRSFSRAAEELFVSQAAISRQVRELELVAGRPLFLRLHRKVELTADGEALLAQVTASFDDIDRALSAVIVARREIVLKVSVEPSFAAAMLVPRLNRFSESHPEIDVLVDSDPRLVEFRSHEADLAIRYGATATGWPRAEARRLLDVSLTPMLAPGLIATGPGLRIPADLSHYTLLHETSRDGWARWFQAAGAPELAQRRGPIFPDAALSIQAARLSHGVALGDRVMEGDDLRAGNLVRPFDIEAPCGAYHLVAPAFRSLGPAAQAFAEWIVGEVGEAKAAAGAS